MLRGRRRGRVWRSGAEARWGRSTQTREPQDAEKTRSSSAVLPLRFSRTPLPIRDAIAHAARTHLPFPLSPPHPCTSLCFVTDAGVVGTSRPATCSPNENGFTLVLLRVKAIKIKFKKGFPPFSALVSKVCFVFY